MGSCLSKDASESPSASTTKRTSSAKPSTNSKTSPVKQISNNNATIPSKNSSVAKTGDLSSNSNSGLTPPPTVSQDKTPIKEVSDNTISLSAFANSNPHGNDVSISSPSSNNNSNNNNNKSLSSEPDDKESKILLLGSGESGKSTIIKQMKIIHQDGYTENELKDYKPFVFRNVLECAKLIASCYIKFDYPVDSDAKLIDPEISNKNNIGDDFKDDEVEPLTIDNIEYINDYISNETNFDDKLIKSIASLWKANSTKNIIIEHGNSFYLIDSAKYFFQNLKRISQKDYIPNVTDVLRTRNKTSGVFETHFNMGSSRVHMIDVGGQRSERKKWIHCFDNVTIIIFCVSLSEYDQTLLEEKSQNRLEESLVLFDSIVNSRWFNRTSVVLFLNKIDVFAEKLPHSPLAKYFPDYTGGDDISKAAKYILWRFKQVNRSNLTIFPHITQATDTNNIKVVFAAVQETILQNSLKDSGIITIN